MTEPKFLLSCSFIYSFLFYSTSRPSFLFSLQRSTKFNHHSSINSFTNITHCKLSGAFTGKKNNYFISPWHFTYPLSCPCWEYFIFSNSLVTLTSDLHTIYRLYCRWRWHFSCIQLCHVSAATTRSVMFSLSVSCEPAGRRKLKNTKLQLYSIKLKPGSKQRGLFKSGS